MLTASHNQIHHRPASQRGITRLDWLDSQHSFSFGEYYDPSNRGYGALRVINEDRVSPAQGFGLHPHQDMEILTYMISGALEHRDNLGNGSIIRKGDVQRMTAGTGVLHSEFNPSETEANHFLQIWLYPNQRGLSPGYEQKRLVDPARTDQWQLLASPEGRDGSLTIHQNAWLSVAFLHQGKHLELPKANNRQYWIQVVRGSIRLDDLMLTTGDGAGWEPQGTEKIVGQEDIAEVLWFDMEQHP